VGGRASGGLGSSGAAHAAGLSPRPVPVGAGFWPVAEGEQLVPTGVVLHQPPEFPAGPGEVHREPRPVGELTGPFCRCEARRSASIGLRIPAPPADPCNVTHGAR
jgi:hypothetical protein